MNATRNRNDPNKPPLPFFTSWQQLPKERTLRYFPIIFLTL